jgi:molybdopterin-synthase adenylyltransferase
MSLSKEEIARYQRHILLKEVGGPGQQRLKAACVALVGVGGLGAPAALYLAAAGIGRLILIDNDTVALSNLQRQIIYRSADVATSKLDAAAAALTALNPHVVLDLRHDRLDRHNAAALLAGADIVLDGSDSFATRHAVNAWCHAHAVPLVSGAVGRWDGQIGVFNAAPDDPCYGCFAPPGLADAEACDAVGVIGALTGVIGAMMAVEAIKLIAKAGDALTGRLLIYDALHAESRVLKLPRDPGCPVCGAPNKDEPR